VACGAAARGAARPVARAQAAGWPNPNRWERAGRRCGPRAHLQVQEDRAGHVLAGARLGEEGVEGVVAAWRTGRRAMTTVKPRAEGCDLRARDAPPMVLSDGIWPSGWMPCSRQ
jgi:hypothetical protein